jgi:hypothetical protein
MATPMPIPDRKWIKAPEYSWFTTNTIHYDIHAWADVSAQFWFSISATQNGLIPKAGSLYKYDTRTGGLVLQDSEYLPGIPEEVYWTRETNALFKACHRRILSLCPELDAYARRSILCHYVKRPDPVPWPRGWTNSYKNTPRGPKPGTGGRPKWTDEARREYERKRAEDALQLAKERLSEIKSLGVPRLPDLL